MAFGLVERGAQVTVCGRTYERAQQLAEAVGGKPLAWDERTSFKAFAVVNATSIGMHPEVDETPLDASGLGRFTRCTPFLVT